MEAKAQIQHLRDTDFDLCRAGSSREPWLKSGKNTMKVGGEKHLPVYILRVHSTFVRRMGGSL